MDSSEGAHRPAFVPRRTEELGEDAAAVEAVAGAWEREMEVPVGLAVL